MGRLQDDAPEKWEYQKHTHVKHAILEKYLSAWLQILGGHHSKVVIFDGFAGRGRYTGGEAGSPVIAIRQAAKVVQEERAEEIICVLIEKSPNNYSNLGECSIERW